MFYKPVRDDPEGDRLREDLYFYVRMGSSGGEYIKPSASQRNEVQFKYIGIIKLHSFAIYRSNFVSYITSLNLESRAGLNGLELLKTGIATSASLN